MSRNRKARCSERATFTCRLVIKDGKVYCEQHETIHPTSWEWDTHRKKCYKLPKKQMSHSSMFIRLPFRHILYAGYLCKCGTILLDEEM